MRGWLGLLLVGAALLLSGPGLTQDGLSPSDRQLLQELRPSERLLQLRSLPMQPQVRARLGQQWEPLDRKGANLIVDVKRIQGPQLELRLEAPGYVPLLRSVPVASLEGLGPGPYRFPRAGQLWRLEKAEPFKIIVPTFPRGALIGLRLPNGKLSALKPAGLPITLSADDPVVRTVRKDSTLVLTLQLPGFADQECLLDWDAAAAEFKRTGRPVQLPRSFMTRLTGPVGVLLYLREIWFPLALLGVATVLGFAFLVLPRLRVHQANLRVARHLTTLRAEYSDNDSLLGRVLGSYRILSYLGRGGMAVVYRAIREEVLTQREWSEADLVAVKVIRRTPGDEETVVRFQREVRTLTMLEHPHIVRLYEWLEEPRVLYLAMELVDGGTLRSRVVEGGLPCGEAIELMRQIADGIQFAHERGVVHRDLKPENIMLTASGVVKVMDFGLARARTFQTVTVSGTTFGTPAYMSPEQIMGAKTLDASTDQYALGVIAYELLTGARPFEEEDPMQTIMKHLTSPPPPLRSHRPELPEEVEKVVARMLAKSAGDRYPSVGEAFRSLDRALQMEVR